MDRPIDISLIRPFIEKQIVGISDFTGIYPLLEDAWIKAQIDKQSFFF
jgi:hypothetical protein